MRQLLHLRSLGALALLLVLAQSALLWHQHDTAAHEHGAPCDVCVHSPAATGIDAFTRSLAEPLFALQRRVAPSAYQHTSTTVFTAFHPRAPPTRLSI